MKIENGVLSVVFKDPIDMVLPDVATTMPNYLSVARLDPDRRGLRIGLKSGFNFNRIEAGEKLFIDLLPTSWQGMPPALPQDIIDELAGARTRRGDRGGTGSQGAACGRTRPQGQCPHRTQRDVPSPSVRLVGTDRGQVQPGGRAGGHRLRMAGRHGPDAAIK
ncbi:hypothetical protein [Devosia aurantiaca]|uniref:Uncharacterized protein n=1 Tax=Devosia aurantiaca TaxID=2714858 RepID=A0A6M1SLE9_9HYPH|nr:hypothetical protein [Devosia aurantiaca]NGP17950.1 hypothetical protein [Devosia aurantiaca]